MKRDVKPETKKYIETLSDNDKQKIVEWVTLAIESGMYDDMKPETWEPHDIDRFIHIVECGQKEAKEPMAFENHKPEPKDPYYKLVGEVVLFLLVTGEEEYIKVNQVTPYTVLGWNDEGQWTVIPKRHISDYVITQ